MRKGHDAVMVVFAGKKKIQMIETTKTKKRRERKEKKNSGSWKQQMSLLLMMEKHQRREENINTATEKAKHIFRDDDDYSHHPDSWTIVCHSDSPDPQITHVFMVMFTEDAILRTSHESGQPE
jgi:hypothetical protein